MSRGVDVVIKPKRKPRPSRAKFRQKNQYIAADGEQRSLHEAKDECVGEEVYGEKNKDVGTQGNRAEKQRPQCGISIRHRRFISLHGDVTIVAKPLHGALQSIPNRRLGQP